MHHPAISQTKGDYDAPWLFVNDNADNRVARVDLRDFKTKEILGPLPNVSGNHGSSFVTPNTEYVLSASRFSIPLPKGPTRLSRSMRRIITASFRVSRSIRTAGT